MAEAYFKAFYSYLENMELLTDEEKGRLFVACLEYAKTGIAPELPGNESFVFPGIRAQIDRDRSSYAVRCEANRKNGEKGGRPAKYRETEKSQGNRKNPIGYFETEKSQGKEKGKDKDKDKEYIPPCNPPKGEADQRFSEFYAAYPRKQAKQAARKAWDKLKPDADTFAALMSALEVQKRSSEWQKDGGQFIPYPATWLNGRRWEDAARASPPKAAPQTDDIDPFLVEFYGG